MKLNTSNTQIPNVYLPEKLTGSVVSYPYRCPEWGDFRFHGNCDGRLFKGLVELYRPTRVGDPMMGSGTTRDVIEGMNRHCKTEITYWGSDLREGFDLQTTKLPGRFDFIWLHPPYWNIVRYSNNPADLSNIDDYDKFIKRLGNCLRRCHEALTESGHLAILVGDVRRRGDYIPIIRDVLDLEGDIGALRSIIIKAQHNCRSNAKDYGFIDGVRITHEYCAVFSRSASAKRRAA